MGAVTVVVRRRNFVGASKEVIADVTFSGSYSAGGDTYTNQNFEFGANDTIDTIIDGGTAGSTTTAYVLLPDIPNKKLRLIGGAASGAALAESGTAGQTGTVARVIVRGANPYI